MIRVLIFPLVLLLASCASDPDDTDPAEDFNRDMQEFNIALDKAILRPSAAVYKECLADELQSVLVNFLRNLSEPFYCVNYLISFNGEQASNSMFRFVINSTLGFGGLFDMGNEVGLKRRETSYKETLRNIEIPTGDYLVLPVFGPSSTRDALAEPVSWFMDPLGYVIGFPYMFAKTAMLMITERADNFEVLDSMMKESLDLYSTAKSMYFQKYGLKNE
ncbi:MAG: VacJ family lipoprotein [Holosporaceae bacterium]|jgi:phospholipid-binding lipoprotein MlaA|nr:VacJ family lipoprotein [Holosporaceae bacterium]